MVLSIVQIIRLLQLSINYEKQTDLQLVVYETDEEETDEELLENFVLKHRAKKIKNAAGKHTEHTAPGIVTKKKLKKEKVMLEEKVIKNVKKNVPKSINTRMSPRSLQKVLESLRSAQVEELEKMGFGAFHSNFNFDSTPSELGMWIVKNFDSKTCSIKMINGRKLKITRELVRDVLGIPMGDIKVEALEEKNLLEETTTKWRN